jgi:hypothetical protein
MPWKLLISFAIFFAAVSIGQEAKTGASAQTRASLSGTVTQAETHLPLRNVQVVIIRGLQESDASGLETAASSDRQFSANTNEKGHFEFADLVPGTYYVVASRVGMVLKGPHSRQRIVVNLQAGQPQTLDVVMLPGAAITGRVLNEDGEPMQYVGVAAMRYTYTILGRRLSQVSTANSDDKGDYRLFGLQPGSYLVVADPGRAAFMNGTGFAQSVPTSTNDSKANSMVYSAKYYPNELSPDQASPVVLKAGDETQANFTFTRVAAHAISGSVSGISAAKQPDKDKNEEHVSVVLAMREGSFLPVGMAQVAKDSSFKINAVPSGKYKVVATEYAGDEDVRRGVTDVVVDSSDVTGVVIALGSAHDKVTGVVRAEDDAKLDYSKLAVVLMPAVISEAQFTSSDLEGGYEGAFADVKKDGTFNMEFSSSDKSYRALVSARGAGFEDWFTSKVLIGGKDVLDSGFKVAEAQRGPIEIVISNKGATVEGIVLDGQQKPFSNAEIIAMPSEPKLRKRPDLFQQAVADQQGHFKIRGVRAGEYIVLALEDSQEQPFATAPFLKNNSGKVQSVKLESGARQQVQLQVIREGQ